MKQDHDFRQTGLHSHRHTSRCLFAAVLAICLVVPCVPTTELAMANQSQLDSPPEIIRFFYLERTNPHRDQ